MAKIIKIGQDALDQMRAEFEQALKAFKLSDGRFTFSKTLNTVERKAKLYFTEIAYFKMLTLVREFDKEVAWHGVAKRHDTEEDAYVISDILVYPQMVTGATVETDQSEYQNWLMGQEDEVFNNIRMQGHSHVNMSTSPSSVDLALYDKFLAQLDDDMFYIFLIWNKRGECTIKIYDMAKNVLFETKDITVETIDGGAGIKEFMKNAKECVKTVTYSAPVVKTNPTVVSNKGTDRFSGIDYSQYFGTNKKKAQNNYNDWFDENNSWGYGGY